MADQRFFFYHGTLSLEQLAQVSRTEIAPGGDTMRLFDDVAPLESATASHISFFTNRKYRTAFAESKAGACILRKEDATDAPAGMALLFADDPYLAYARIAAAFHPEPHPATTISKQAAVHPSAVLGRNITIAPGAVIEEGAEIGNHAVIGANTVIGRGVVIGEGTRIAPNCTITHALIGNHCILHPGVQIGQDGFGFAFDRATGQHEKVPQLGRVVIEDRVEIGANSCIDRGAGPDTIIGAGTKIDNLVQIGHNVVLGKGCILVSQVGISGSTHFGDYAVAGGKVGVAGHLRIGAGAQLAAGSGVIKDVAPKEMVGGYPAIPIKQWHRQNIKLKQLVNVSKGSEA